MGKRLLKGLMGIVAGLASGLVFTVYNAYLGAHDGFVYDLWPWDENR